MLSNVRYDTMILVTNQAVLGSLRDAKADAEKPALAHEEKLSSMRREHEAALTQKDNSISGSNRRNDALQKKTFPLLEIRLPSGADRQRQVETTEVRFMICELVWPIVETTTDQQHKR